MTMSSARVSREKLSDGASPSSIQASTQIQPSASNQSLVRNGAIQKIEALEKEMQTLEALYVSQKRSNSVHSGGGDPHALPQQTTPLPHQQSTPTLLHAQAPKRDLSSTLHSMGSIHLSASNGNGTPLSVSKAHSRSNSISRLSATVTPMSSSTYGSFFVLPSSSTTTTATTAAPPTTTTSSSSSSFSSSATPSVASLTSLSPPGQAVLAAVSTAGPASSLASNPAATASGSTGISTAASTAEIQHLEAKLATISRYVADLASAVIQNKQQQQQEQQQQQQQGAEMNHTAPSVSPPIPPRTSNSALRTAASDDASAAATAPAASGLAPHLPPRNRSPGATVPAHTQTQAQTQAAARRTSVGESKAEPSSPRSVTEEQRHTHGDPYPSAVTIHLPSPRNHRALPMPPDGAPVSPALSPRRSGKNQHQHPAAALVSKEVEDLRAQVERLERLRKAANLKSHDLAKRNQQLLEIIEAQNELLSTLGAKPFPIPSVLPSAAATTDAHPPHSQSQQHTPTPAFAGFTPLSPTGGLTVTATAPRGDAATDGAIRRPQSSPTSIAAPLPLHQLPLTSSVSAVRPPSPHTPLFTQRTLSRSRTPGPPLPNSLPGTPRSVRSLPRYPSGYPSALAPSHLHAYSQPSLGVYYTDGVLPASPMSPPAIGTQAYDLTNLLHRVPSELYRDPASWVLPSAASLREEKDRLRKLKQRTSQSADKRVGYLKVGTLPSRSRSRSTGTPVAAGARRSASAERANSLNDQNWWVKAGTFTPRRASGNTSSGNTNVSL